MTKHTIVRGLLVVATMGMLAIPMASQRGVANCPPGTRFAGWDCSARNEHNASCNSDYYSTLAGIVRTKSGCFAGCEFASDTAECRKRCAAQAAAEVAIASATLASCRSRAPACEPICEPLDPSDPDHPDHANNCPNQLDAIYCELAGGTWDHYTESCNYG